MTGGMKWWLGFAVLMLAGLSLPPGASGVDDRLPDNVIAAVEGDSVLGEEFLYYLEAKEVNIEGKTPDERAELLREYLTDRKLAGEARKSGLVDAPEVREIADAMDRRELPDRYFQKEFLEKTVLEEKDFEPLFEGLAETADIRAATFAAEGEAREFRTLLLSGETFESLAKNRSVGISASKGGFLQGIVQGDVRFTLEEKNAIFSAAPGDVLGPFTNKLEQFSVLRVERVQRVEDLKREIRRTKEREVLENKAAAAYALRLNEEMVATEIEINEEYFDENAPEGPKKPYLAWIRGRYIYPKDLGVDESPESHGKKVYRANLNKMLRSIVAAAIARKAGMADEPEYRRKQEAFLVSRLAELKLKSVYKSFQPSVTEREKKAFYKENFHPEVYSIWVVVNKDRGKVEKARKEILSGKNPSEVARDHSDDMSRMRGGTAGPVPYSSFAPEVRSRLSSLKEGKLSEVFRMNEKFVILRVDEKKKVPVPEYKEVKEEILSRLQSQMRAKAAQDYRVSAIRKESVRIDREKLAALK